MVVFALRVPDDKRVQEWIGKVNVNLSRVDFLRNPFTGSIRYEHGMVVGCVRPLYSRWLLNAFLFFYFVAAITIGMLLSAGVGRVLCLFGGIVVLVVNLFWTPVFYQLVIWLQVRRLLGEWYRVPRADSEVLEMVAYGKI